MTAPDLDAIAARYSAALNAKPSKGEWTQRGIDALTDSVSDVGELLAYIDSLREAARTLGRVVEVQCRDALEASGVQGVIGEDGDGDWELIWETLHALRPRAVRAEAQVQAARSWAESIEGRSVGHAALARDLRTALDTGCHSEVTRGPMSASGDTEAARGTFRPPAAPHARAGGDDLRNVVRTAARELQGLASKYTRAPGENGDRVADLLTADSWRIGEQLAAALTQEPVYVADVTTTTEQTEAP